MAQTFEFIGRHHELEVLEREWQASRSSFVPIYGHRRVGKSELILRFLRDKTAIYLLGKRAPAGLQIRELLELAAEVLDEPLLASYSATGWGDAIDAIVERAPAGTKLALVFDELQWMVETSPELPSILHERWDRHWQHDGRVMLIVCGSFVGFMERDILGRRSPLYGRRTAQILLQPFGFREAAGFHPGYSRVDRARTYMLCGGVPYYLRLFSDRQSVEMNIAAGVLDEHAPLHREPDFLLREELEGIESYYAILLAVASGQTAAPDIARLSQVRPGSIHYYLKQLIELGYLTRRYPLTDTRPSRKDVRYDLGDPFLRFWFHFVYPDQSQLRLLGPERVLRQRIVPRLDAYLGHCFERLCREALPLLYAREGVEAALEIGEYWSRSTQIDVVGLRDDGWTDLGECKWGGVRSAASLERELEEKVRLYPNRRNATIGRRVFARSGRPGGSVAGGARWHGLEELYG